jgi:hypothetical protein
MKGGRISTAALAYIAGVSVAAVAAAIFNGPQAGLRPAEARAA